MGKGEKLTFLHKKKPCLKAFRRGVPYSTVKDPSSSGILLKFAKLNDFVLCPALSRGVFFC